MDLLAITNRDDVYYARKPEWMVSSVILLSGAVLFGSLIRGTPVGRHMRSQHGLHVFIHFGCFALLTFFSLQLTASSKRRGLLLLLGFVLAIGSEYIEHLFGHFSIEFGDVAANVAGQLFSLIVSLVFGTKRGQNRAGRSLPAATVRSDRGLEI